MPQFDLPLEQLWTYRPDVREPADFDSFWERTLAESRAVGGEVELTELDQPLGLFDMWDVTYPGFVGQPIKAWYVRPAGVEEDLPIVIHYAGYGGGRGDALQHTFWAAAGYAHLVMDTRGQASAWGNGGGATADPNGSGPAHPGYMTRGILSPDEYYYRRVFTDAVRAVDAARRLPGVDGSRVIAHGGSQGGGITLAVSGLVPDLAAVIADVSFLCHFERATTLTDADPYGEIRRYLSVHRDHVNQVFDTLSYFDGVNFAKRANAPSLWSVGLMDDICPPSTTFAAFNRYGEGVAGAAGTEVPKTMEIYPFNGHEGGQGHQDVKKLAFLADLLA